MIGLVLPLILRLGVPERFGKLVGWIALAIAALVLVGAAWGAWGLWLSNRDEAVIVAEDTKREAAAVELREVSAEERAVDALANQMAREKREEAIKARIAIEAAKAPAARATQPPQVRALNCQLMREDYSAAELEKLKAYRENCK